MVDGKEITLGGQKYTLPPIPLSGLARLGDRIKTIGGDDPDAIDALIDGVHISLRRNYPDIERVTVDNNIDPLNFAAVLEAFTAVNGFVVAEETPGKRKRGK